eukprot:jgi/Mesen1/7720/ME000407S06939
MGRSASPRAVEASTGLYRNYVRDRDERRRSPPRHHGQDDDDDDDDLKGLDFLEYRIKKRDKLRERGASAFWRATPSPSPPRERASPDYGDYDKSSNIVARSKEEHNEEEGLKRSKRPQEEDDDSKAEEKGSGRGREKGDEEDDDEAVRKTKKKRGRSRERKRRQSTSESESESASDKSSDDSDSEDEKRRRRKSSSKRSRHKDHSRKKRREERSTKKEKRKSKSKSRKKSRRTPSDSEESDKEEAKVASEISDEDAKALVDSGIPDGEDDEEAQQFKEYMEAQKRAAGTSLEDEPIVGPAPAPKAEGHISYGGAMRPGEGDAIAQFVQQGKRIPRRGEVGLNADEISKFEDLGYVMSGSRHQRMNAIRIRKENQVYSAEDKRALAMFNYEEKAKREHKVMSDLQRLVQRHMKEDVAPNHDPFPENPSQIVNDLL